MITDKDTNMINDDNNLKENNSPDNIVEITGAYTTGGLSNTENEDQNTTRVWNRKGWPE